MIPLAVLKPGGDAATALYIVAFSLFIIGLKQGTHPSTARRGNKIAAVGMAVAVVTTLLLDGMGNWGYIAIGLAIGSSVGAYASIKVKMTEMPQMVALYNGVGGGAVALIAWSEIRHGIHIGGAMPLEELIPTLLAGIIGSVSFWGSNIAFAKLQDLIPTRPIAVPGQQFINAILGIGVVVVAIIIVINNEPPSQGLFILILVAAAILGNLVVLPIGGADMPVVISMLNSYSGWAAAGIGFTLGNSALIITGALVGSSGAILSYIMCHAMNRSFISVILGGFGGETVAAGGPGGEQKPAKLGSADDAAFIMKNASKVIIVPGYGMAVAQAQHALREMADTLKKEGVEVKYAIHPVAGRMPGHMNVLLAEANVPYDEVFELEDINGEFAQTDVAFVIGANDITNPAAKTDPASPIYGMPILDVERARTVLFIKRSLASGYAGIENELFFYDNTMMLFGDAKKMCEDIIKSLQG